jgi:GntR family transcriptional repressor for pyruvate dehydrogenase complex
MTGVADRRKLHERVMGDVLAAILAGEYAVGEGLPREVDLAAKHDVSRYVARECIQALRDRGVLSVKHGRGTTIAPQAEWNLFDATLLSALLGGPEGDATRADAAECRVFLWPEAAALAAGRRSPADLERLETAAGQGEGPFLQELAAVSGNRFLRHVLFSLDGVFPPATEPPGAVLEAIRAGDADAAREAMRAHLG